MLPGVPLFWWCFLLKWSLSRLVSTSSGHTELQWASLKINCFLANMFGFGSTRKKGQGINNFLENLRGLWKRNCKKVPFVRPPMRGTFLIGLHSEQSMPMIRLPALSLGVNKAACPFALGWSRYRRRRLHPNGVWMMGAIGAKGQKPYSRCHWFSYWPLFCDWHLLDGKWEKTWLI
jgi:hypothetical protein